MRTKASVHTLSGHTNAVATVRCQAAEPQIITGKINTFKFTMYSYQHIIVHVFFILAVTLALYCVFCVSVCF